MKTRAKNNINSSNYKETEEVSEKKNLEYCSEASTSTTESPCYPTSSRPKHRRKRKSHDQVKYLKEKFYENPNWSKQEVKQISRKLGLSESQVYKWGWDYKKKLRLEGLWGTEHSLLCSEVLVPDELSNSLFFIQRSYRAACGSWNLGFKKLFHPLDFDCI